MSSRRGPLLFPLSSHIRRSLEHRDRSHCIAATVLAGVFPVTIVGLLAVLIHGSWTPRSSTTTTSSSAWPVMASLPKLSGPKKRGNYNCGSCGKPKKGHVCLGPIPAPAQASSSGAARAGGVGGRKHKQIRRTLSFDEVTVDIQGDDTPSSQRAASKKKMRGAAGDKNVIEFGKLCARVYEIVKRNGRTTMNEVADELVAEFSNPNVNIDSPDLVNPSRQQFEKNIRRRFYDALNILLAVEIISKDKNEIQWRGLPGTSMNDMEELKTKAIDKKKKAELQDLQDQYAYLQNLVRRNKQLHGSGDAPSSQVALLVKWPGQFH